MGQFSPIKKHVRARPEIIRQIEMAMNKLDFALDEYKRTGLPDANVEFSLRQAQHTIDAIERDLSIYH